MNTKIPNVQFIKNKPKNKSLKVPFKKNTTNDIVENGSNTNLEKVIITV